MKIHSEDFLWIITLVISALLVLNIFIQANFHKYPTPDTQLFINEPVMLETDKPADSVGLGSKPLTEQEAVEEETVPILPFELRGTIIGESCLAFIYNSDSNTSKLYKLNDTIGDLKIVKIVQAKVILERENVNWELLLSGQHRKIETVVMSRSEMISQLPKANELLSKIKILPSPDIDSDKLKGFSIDNIPSGSIIEKAGIKSGDIIHSVEGNVLESVPAAWRIFNSIRSQSQIEVVLLRGNMPVILRYEIIN